VIYDVDRPFYFRPVSKVFITAFPFFNRAIKLLHSGEVNRGVTIFITSDNRSYVAKKETKEREKKWTFYLENVREEHIGTSSYLFDLPW